MFCTKCGNENVDGAAFCQSCGAQLSGSGAGTQTTAPKPTAPKPASKKKLIIIAVVTFLVICGIVDYIRNDKDDDYTYARQNDGNRGDYGGENNGGDYNGSGNEYGGGSNVSGTNGGKTNGSGNNGVQINPNQPVDEPAAVTITYTSPITGNTFTVSDVNTAVLVYDGEVSSVPSSLNYYPADTASLYTYLDGETNASRSEKYIHAGVKINASGFTKGKTLGMKDFDLLSTSITVKGIYRDPMWGQPVIYSNTDPDYFDDVYFELIDRDDMGDMLQYYFYLKLKNNNSTHTIEYVAYVDCTVK